MALACPTLIVTQTPADLPFNIRDMQSLPYDRNRLGVTLSQPLQRLVMDTLSVQNGQQPAKQDERDLVGELLAEVADLKGMVAQAVRSWNPPAPAAADAGTIPGDLIGLEGAWIDAESGSHCYAKVIGSDLIVPYCFMGDREVTGAYFDWRKTGPYWFARYAWLDRKRSGFAFLRQESVDVLRGAWWDDGQGLAYPAGPPDKAGVPETWRRATNTRFPDWAFRFLEDVQREGLGSRLARR
ncbi:MAG: hypothetical protein ACLQOO_35855 [Terriglobia bacterium]